MLQVRNLEVRYGAIRALRGIDIDVPEAGIVALIGCNGAGKSTLLRAVSGLVRPAAGSLQFEGKPLERLAPHEIVKLGVAHAPEGRGIFANFSVRENLEMGAFIRRDRSAIASDQERVLTLFPRLKERLSQNAGTLSGGEQQMLAIGRALLSRPRLLLLDEPSLGLAPQIVHAIFQIVREINAAGTTILLVEQNAHMALMAAHYAYVLEVGSIVLHGPARDLAHSDDVRRAYLGVA